MNPPIVDDEYEDFGEDLWTDAGAKVKAFEKGMRDAVQGKKKSPPRGSREIGQLYKTGYDFARENPRQAKIMVKRAKQNPYYLSTYFGF